jgi:hypothetical protein
MKKVYMGVLLVLVGLVLTAQASAQIYSTSTYYFTNNIASSTATSTPAISTPSVATTTQALNVSDQSLLGQTQTLVSVGRTIAASGDRNLILRWISLAQIELTLLQTALNNR